MQPQRRPVYLLALILLSALLLGGPLPARAADPPPLVAHPPALAACPPTLALSGTLGAGALGASLRLLPAEDLGSVKLFVTDLQDATGDDLPRPPLAAGAVTLLPATEFVTLTAGALTQVMVQIAPPSRPGTYTGTLHIQWARPTRGQMAVPLTLIARSQPALALESGSQLAANGVRGQQMERRIVLRETTPYGSALSGLQAMPRDFLSAEGNALPAPQTRLTLPATTIEGGQAVMAALAVDLAGVPAGAYTGDIVFTYDGGAPVALSATVNVRDSAIWALLVLLLGAVTGLGLTWYQTMGQPRDELTVRIARIRRALDVEGGPQAGFRTQLEIWVRKASSALETQDWETAKAALHEADTLLTKWHTADWGAQIDYAETLSRTIEAAQEEETAIALQALHNRIQQALEQVHTRFATTAALREELLAIEAARRRFEDTRAQLKAIGDLRLGAPPSLAAEKAAWQERQEQMERRLRTEMPETEAWTELTQSADELGSEMVAAIQQAERETGQHEHLSVKGVRSPGMRGGEDVVRRWLRLKSGERDPGDSPPWASETVTPKNADDAWKNLRILRWVTWGLSALLLMAIGYVTLYAPNLTFGARASDYIALAGWGLGAQMTSAGVAGALQSWGIPFGQKPQA